MSWNHRVIRQRQPDGSEWLGIHQVFYNDDGSSAGYTEQAMPVSGETLDELGQTLAWMQKALTEPILEDADFVGFAEDEDDIIGFGERSSHEHYLPAAPQTDPCRFAPHGASPMQ